MRSTRTFAFASAALLGAGCATDYDLERQRPDPRFVSAKPLGEVRQCVYASLSALGRPEITEGERETRIAVRTTGGYPATFVTLRPTSRGTTVVVRQAISYSIGRSIERCL